LVGLQAAARIAVLAGMPVLATATYEKMANYGSNYKMLRRRYRDSTDKRERTERS